MTTLTKKGPPRGRRPFSGLCSGYKKYNSPEARSQSSPPPAVPVLPAWMTKRLLGIARYYSWFLTTDNKSPVSLGNALAAATNSNFILTGLYATIHPTLVRYLPEGVAAALSNNSVLSLTPLEQAALTIAGEDQRSVGASRSADPGGAVRLWFSAIADMVGAAYE